MEAAGREMNRPGNQRTPCGGGLTIIYVNIHLVRVLPHQKYTPPRGTRAQGFDW